MNKEVYLVKSGSKRIKKISIKKLIDNINNDKIYISNHDIILNLECFNKKFFTTKKDAKEHIKNDR